MQKSERISRVIEALWSWYASHKRDLPWRHFEGLSDADRAYRVLVSEIMLQQTQVPRVTVLFPLFLDRFPTIQDLAKASNKEILIAWKGLGYNSRALRLRDAARIIVDRHQGKFPHELPELRAIPGIGPYTAAAIRNFAFDLPTPCIDVNIARIYLRVFAAPEKTLTNAELDMLTADILAVAIDPSRGRTAREWHSALMDFGSLVCTKKNPKYDDCPLYKENLYLDPYKETGLPKAKNEPSRNGIPNRIYRGRIVESLRTSSRGLTPLELGTKICDDWNRSKDDVWLTKILSALVKDTLLTKKGSRYVLTE